MGRGEGLVSIARGGIVLARAGRDKNKYFLVLKTEDNFVYICDGKSRRIQKPKKKKIKHVTLMGYAQEDICTRLKKEGQITNSEVSRYLNEYRDMREGRKE